MKMTTVKYQNGKVHCPKCGGMIAYDATMTDKLPMGMGFNGMGKFKIDFVIRKGFRGECMDCYHKVFAVKSITISSKCPKSINEKIKKVRQK